jgi:hypothetical protein
MRIARLGLAAAVAVALIGSVSTSSAQTLFQGRIDVTVQDATGAVLPGVTVGISGPQNATQVTDAQGEAHFLNLGPGTYEVRATLQGFQEYVNRAVMVTAGVSVPLRVNLRVAGVAEAVQVIAESPVVDTKKQTTATNVTAEELQNVPSSRDPWVVLQTVPSIMVDRVNVGGAESGQQSTYFGKGSTFQDNTWNIDGIPITDMAALGASPTYYDFDAFAEMQVTTGGADVNSTTPGVQLNFVLKQGGNTPHGSARYYFANEGLQSNNMPDDLADIIGGASRKGNRTKKLTDVGFELGGPIVRDRLWAWGSWSRTEPQILTLIDTLDKTQLPNISFKTQAQVTDAIRAGFTYFLGDKKKQGRDASPLRPPETTFNQEGPTKLYKGEGNFVVGQNLFVTARGAYTDMGFQLVPQGGLGTQPFRDTGRVWRNTFQQAVFGRPQSTVLADGNWFRGRHEVKFGFGWRKAASDQDVLWPGGGYNDHLSNYANDGGGFFFGLRPFIADAESVYTGGYIGDTISLDRMTINLGLRIDNGKASANEVTQPANPLIPEILPSVTAPAVKNAVDITSVTPRLGIVYSLDETRKTQVRASYAIFGSQLSAAQGGILSGASYAWIALLTTDSNRNGTAERNEISNTRIGFAGFDPANPTATRSFNRVSEDLKPSKTHELIVGLDREVMANFGVSASLSYRRMQDMWWQPLIGVRRPDYRQDGAITGTLPNGSQFSVPYFALDSASKIPTGAGVELENREGYHQRYLGFEIQGTKRMSDNYMFRVGFSVNDHREYFDNPDTSIQDPTPTQASPFKDGGLVIRQTGGSGKSQIFLVPPKYQFIANGLYQAPWGINVGLNMVTRQGYGTPYFRSNVATTDPFSRLKSVSAVQDIDEFRLPSVTSFDARVGKAFNFNRTSVHFDVDIFNAFNASTVLGRQYDLNATGRFQADRVLEIMNPRIVRLGLRFNF